MVEEKSRKELLEEPDPFMVFAQRMLNLAKQYQQQLVMGALAVILAAVVISALMYYRHQAEERAAQMLGKAVARYQAVEYRDPNIVNPKPPSAADYEAVRGMFKEIISKYASTGAGRAALVHYGDLSYKAGDYDEAISTYQQALDAFSKETGLRSMILSGLAYACEAKKDDAGALKYLEMIVNDPNAVLKDQALFNLARIYGRQGKTALQTEAWQRIISDYPDSMYYPMVKEKLSE